MPLLASCSPEAQIPEPLRKLVERKCGNCHSETVEWPSYSPLMRLGPARSLCRSFAAAIEMVRYRNCGRPGRSRAVRTRASPKSNVTASARATLKTQLLLPKPGGTVPFQPQQLTNQNLGSTSTIYGWFRVEYLPTSWQTTLLIELSCCKAP